MTSQKRQQQQEQWLRIKAIIAKCPDGASLQSITDALSQDVASAVPPRRTLQFWLKKWVDAGCLRTTGARRGVRYFLADGQSVDAFAESESRFPFSETSWHCLQAVRRPVIERRPVAYNVDFLNAYRPNVSTYLTDAERAHLGRLGKGQAEQPVPAGTFARQLLNRFLIDLSWNSSRLEGNTYSLIDTRRLIHFGVAADSKTSLETQMILNHKDAIEFLVGSAEDIGFNHYTILNLHALLSNNLLENPQASGRLRSIAVGIGDSVFQPLELPQRIEACFGRLLAIASAIQNPYEQALFALVQFPYLQAFDDVNKRVSRLAANIPFIKHNLIPLSFTDVPKNTYIDAILSVYELNRVEPLKEVFIWACERSADYYKVVRQTLGEPDEFRLRYRQALKTVIGEVIRSSLNKQQAYTHIKRWGENMIPKADQAQFQENAESELLNLHEGNFARYQLRPTEFEQWQKIWQNSKENKA